MSEYAGSSLNRWGRRVVLAVGSSIGVNVQTVSATVTLAAQSAMIQLINGGAASRDVALPVDAALAGGMQLIKNTGATNNLVVKYGATTIATLAPSEWAICSSVTGLIWYAATVSGTFSGAISAVTATFTGRVTTTDGVTSGDARIVGGVVSAKSTTTSVANTTVETAAGTYSVPANTIKAGSTVRIRAAVKCTGQAGGHTVTIRVKLGSATLLTSGALNMVANDVAEFTAIVSGRAAPGASVALASLATATVQQSAVVSTVSAVKDAASYTAQATNGALTAQITVQWSSADVLDIVTCDQFIVEVIG